ncbi:hypothetical protein [Hyphomicrobium sp.]|uniref:hypothetical protein n=1 Tax=Hyphomicrobium sp. TaxID=82 RepID=UPI000FC0B89E|nr:hypothetical protein [Hyphomicrobium sp.]RUO99266.1 MAG: hypothetical protein EKK30_08555 [Hyphomicrobium sp.]
MPEKFCAELLVRSERDRVNDRLEITICNIAGEARTISLSEEAVAGLASLLSDHVHENSKSNVTKLPDSFAVGHGRHEPVVMLRFEEDAAYGLTADQALGLGEALIEEAETIATKVRYPTRQ